MSTLIDADIPTLPNPTPVLGAEASRAFLALAPERAALKSSQLVTAFNPSKVALVYLGRADKLEAFKAALIAAGARPERLKLRDRALALWHADLELAFAERGPNAAALLVTACRQGRDLIIEPWGGALVQWGVLTEAERVEARSGRTHDEIAKDVVFLASRVIERWSLIEGKVTFEQSDAQQLLLDGEALMYALARKGVVPAIDPARDNVKRAFTLLVESVQNELRPGLTWIHRDDPTFQLDAVCPSVYSLRGGASRKTTATPTPAPSEPAADDTATA